MFEHQARAVCAQIQARGVLPPQVEMEVTIAADRAARLPGERLYLGFASEEHCEQCAAFSGTDCTYMGRFKGVVPGKGGRINPRGPAKL